MRGFRLGIIALVLFAVLAPSLVRSQSATKPAGGAEPGPSVSPIADKTPEPVLKDESTASPVSKSAEATEAKDKAREPSNKYFHLAEKALSGDAAANNELMKAIGEGDTEAKDALIMAINAEISRSLRPKVEKGDLDAMQKLIAMAKKGDPSARQALDKAYAELAELAAGGDKKSNLAMEFAAQEGEDVQGFLDEATKAREKPGTDEPPALPQEKKAGKDAKDSSKPPDF